MFDLAGADLTCPPVAAAACNAPTNLGTVALGGLTTASSTLVPFGREAWYQVSFTGETNSAYHPSISFSINPGSVFRFDVHSDCVNPSLPCGEGGLANGLLQWEVQYGLNNGYDASASMFVPIPPVGNAGTVWIRVYRPVGPATCDMFTLTVTNLCAPNLLNGTDPNNCGGCGTACAALPGARPACVMNKCGFGGCLNGYLDCNNNEADGCECHGMCVMGAMCM